jgi:hypothetical protein
MNVRERLRVHCARPPRSVLYDEDAGVFLDIASGKTLAVPDATIQSIEERTDNKTFRPYVALLLQDGRALALTDAGVAFAPLFTNTGPLEELPAAVCWNDFHTLAQQLKHELYGHPDVEPGAATVRVLMCCLAIVDGARAAGFDVGREEQELEWHLKELERRAPS